MRPPQCSWMAKSPELLYFTTSRKSLLMPLTFVVMTLILMNSFCINSDVVYNSKIIPLKSEQSEPHLIGVGIIKKPQCFNITEKK